MKSGVDWAGDMVVLAVSNIENGLADSGDMDAERADGPEIHAESPTYHRPALLAEAMEQLLVRPGGIYLDGTVGEGGHSLDILRASAPTGRVLGIDRDPRSLATANQRLESFGGRFTPVHGNYADMVDLARNAGLDRVDGVLLDLGLSSRHIETPGYGFSFLVDEPLDMRFDPGAPLTADEIVNTYTERELAQILFRYGEEPRANRVARAIVRNRPVTSTASLARLVAGALGYGGRRRTHPATRTFQALRIAVNEELDYLEAGLSAAFQILRRGGRLVAISYHSLEDRIVKKFLTREAANCICPPEVPICVCEHQAAVRIVNRRIIRPSSEEVRANPRSRSARMRAAEKL